MGFIGSLLSNDKGAGFQASGTDIASPVTERQVNSATNNVTGGIDAQRAFLNAIQGQGGLGNQASVFAQQQALANQLSQQAMGAGPNPALAQLNQATGQNVANQAALMAGVRGASSNPGLIARQAAQQGANIQQQAVGQGATMQAQQQLAAQQALQNQQAQLAGVANSQVGQQAQAVSGLNQYSQGAQQNLLAGIGNQNNANVAMQSNINNANAGIAQGNQKAQAGILSGLMSGVSGIGSLLSGGGSAGAGGGGGAAMAANPAMMAFSSGGKVPGAPMVGGDNIKNDVVPAMLSPGEVVIPRHVMESDDPAKGAAEFIKQIMSKKKDPADAKAGYFDQGGMAGIPTLADIQASGQALPPNLQAVIAPPTDANVAAMPTEQPGDLMHMSESPIQTKTFRMPQTNGLGEMSAPQSQSEVPALGASGDVAMLANSFADIKKGQEMEAKALGDQGRAEAGIIGEQVKAMSAQQQKSDQAFKDLDAERLALTQSVMDGKIDPNRYVGSMSTGQKLSTAIGLIMGGMGAGIVGGENPAMKYLNNQIENDINAQKTDLGKKESLLSRNLQQFGNLRDATAMTRANMADLASLQMKQKAAQAQDPIAKARLLQEAGKLDMQAAQLIGPLKAKQQVLSAYKQGRVGADVALNYIVPEKDQKAAREELVTVDGYKKAARGINDIFAGLKKMGAVESNLPFTKSKAEYNAAKALIVQTIRSNMKGQGALSDQEQKSAIDPLLPNSTDTVDQLETKLSAIQGILSNKVSGGTPTLSGYGLGMDTSMNKLSSQEQRLLNFAKANPNNPKSVEIMRRLGQ